MRILVFAFAYAATSSAWASEASDCHMFTSDTVRLGCYDKATGFSAEVTSEPEDASDEKPKPKVPSKWSVSTKKSDLDDSTNVYLALTSDDYIRGRFGESGPMILNINCRENTTRLYIIFNGMFMSDYQYGTVTYRLDNKKAAKKRMQESTDHEALGLWNGGASIPFIKKMFGHEKMLVQATPYNESAVKATFTIAGIEEEIKPLREACNW